MHNNNFSEYPVEEMNNGDKDNNCNTLAKFSNKKTNLNCNTLQENYLNNPNQSNALKKSYLIRNNNSNYFLIPNQNNISLSERMKAKIQKTKEQLEKKQYKASENYNNMNEYCNRDQKNFPFKLESAYEFSELKNNNCCKRNECPDCINIMTSMNYIENYNKNINKNNKQLKNLNKNAVKSFNAKNSISKEKVDLTDNNKNIDAVAIGNKNFNKCKDKEIAEDDITNAMAKNNDFNSNISNNESFSSNGNSKNSLMDLSLNENSFNGIINRNNLSKKELKMLRNRISAQKSRDRKKKEMDDLKIITQELFNQNIKLKKQLEEKENTITEIKNIFNSLCKICKGRLNNKLSSNMQIEDNVLNDNVVSNNCKYLESAETIICCDIKETKILNKSIDDLRNNLISNKRNRVVDFPTIVNSGNRRINNNIKCGLVTGFLVIACIVGSFAFDYGISSTNDYYSISQEKNFPGRILQEKTVNELIKFGNKSSSIYIIL